MFSRPMLETRQEFQPSMNLREPISVSIVVPVLPDLIEHRPRYRIFFHGNARVIVSQPGS